MGKIIDYISGEEVIDKPEEIEAVQPFARTLVEDYGYPKTYIQTHPQFRVKVRPSDTKKEYPVDIVIFKSENKKDGEEQIIVECKKKNESDGIGQLEDYLRFCRATIGVWFNGDELRYIRKHEFNGKIQFESIPNIPRFGQRLEDLGKFQRKDLIEPKNLKTIFRASKNYLAANNVGAVKDEPLAQQLINIIFCKIYDERFTAPNDSVRFRVGINENLKDVKDRILSIFDEVKKKYKDVFTKDDKIELSEDSLKYLVGSLQDYCLTDAKRDVISDAFEVFIGRALKGDKGQFFTPRNVVKMMIEIIDPQDNEIILDPACGSGGFLVEALRYGWEKIEQNGLKLNWSNSNLEEEKKAYAINSIRGMDLDGFLTKVCKAYMAIIGDGKGHIFVEDSLADPSKWSGKAHQYINKNQFDIIITNPPFGKDLTVDGEAKLKQYELGYKWKYDKDNDSWEKDKLQKKVAPQILFIERCLDYLVEGGRMGIVLPDGIFGNESMSYIRSWLIKKAKILAIIDIPLETFLPMTGTKTSVLFLQKQNNIKENYEIFMAIAETCGHDRRGKETDSDDILEISKMYHDWKESQ